jgi:hypothetical protein
MSGSVFFQVALELHTAFVKFVRWQLCIWSELFSWFCDSIVLSKFCIHMGNLSIKNFERNIVVAAE